MAKTKPEAGGLGRAKFQGYECIEVHRSALKNAPYNPRVMTDKQRDRLRKGMKRLKLLSPPTWNVRSGNLVAGHQRMSIMDGLEGTDDYTLTVARVDLSEKEEKEANILLNNQEAQGDFEMAKLEEMLSDKTLDIEATGFDLQAVYKMFGADPIMQRNTAMDELAKQVRASREAYDRAVGSTAVRDETEFYLVLVFRDTADATAFCAELGVEDNRYQDGREWRRIYRERSEVRDAEAARGEVLQEHAPVAGGDLPLEAHKRPAAETA